MKQKLQQLFWSRKAALNLIVSAWTSGISYYVGEYVIRNGLLYKCNATNSDTTFTDSKWTQTTITT